MRRNNKVPLMILLVLTVLAGCGSSKPELVSEQRMIEDIYTKSRDLREADLDITDYEITARQTSEELDTDTVWLCYFAENDEAVYYGESVLYYQYVGDAWELSDWDRGDCWYTAKYDCDPAIALEYLQEAYSQTETTITMMDQVSWADNECHFVYQVTGRDNPVCSWTDSWSVDCIYDLRNGWQVAEADGEKIQEVWDICGTYVCNNENISATVELSSFEIDVASNSATATLSYSFTSYMDNGDIYGGPAMQQGTTYYSPEPATVVCSMGSENRYVVIRVGDIAELYICGRYVSWDPIGEGLGIWVKVLGNYTQTYGEYWLYLQ